MDRDGGLTGPSAGGRRRRWTAALAAVLSLALLASAFRLPVGGTAPAHVPGAVRAAEPDLRITGFGPDSYDPAESADVGTAATLAQLYEGLTAFDYSLNVRPALARDWQVDTDGRRIVFRLRDGLTFSDGTPLTADDVVRSWLRVVDPERPSPLASLLADVEGALDYLAGRQSDPETVGIRALDRERVEVRFRTPASYFLAAAASPTLAVVPPGIETGTSLRPGTFVGSGGYVLAATGDTALTLEANARYWAGPPALGRIEMVTDLAGESPVTLFEDGRLDYTDIASYDASWIGWDRDLGPSLRAVPSLTVEYYGFDATRQPFDDERVRRAFALAVDWRRLATLAGADYQPANSLVPPGIPGRSDADFLPPHDPDEARRLLADAGYPNGAGFPDVALQTGGTFFDAAVRESLREELGLSLRAEVLEDYFGRLDGDDPPLFWHLGWIADYPHPQDFLGLLLGAEQVTNYGRWSDPEYEAALTRAAEATDPAAQRAAYDEAERIVQARAPIVPVAYSAGWALSREGLLGADPAGIGIIRFAGLAWAR